MGVSSNTDYNSILKEYLWLAQKNTEDEAWDEKVRAEDTVNRNVKLCLLCW